MDDVCSALSLEGKEISLQFCDDEHIKALNNTYRDIDEPTDILSFPQQEKIDIEFPCDTALLGDMVISIDTLKRNAKYFKVDEAVELKRILIHGMLHLVGYDHETNDSAEPMIKYQESLLIVLLRTDVK